MSDLEETATAPLIQHLPPSPAQPLVKPPADYLHPDFQKLDHCRTVAFFHPGYLIDGTRHDPAVELLRLPAYDNGGLHYGTAMSAMSIIAFNKSGYLTVDTPGGCRVEESWDYILPGEKNYYYHLDDPTTNRRYPICSSFVDWPFDPSTIPLEWRSAFNITSSDTPIVAGSHMSSGVRDRDVSCRITGSPDANDNAHIIPRAELVWFLNNGLHTYTHPLRSPSPSAIDDVQNGLLLRKDLRFLFDQRLFTTVVKAQALVSHYLGPTNTAAALYHNAQVRLPPAAQPVEFFWARFAWSIIPYVGPFDERIGQIPRLENPVEEADAAPNPRKCKTTTVDKTEVLDPTAAPVRQLELEMERDNELQRHFLPDMKEETACSGDATLQFANWYPGMQNTERFKSWWYPNHPQISETHFLPEMKEETAWSGDATWQFANWYPGMQHTERVKSWWYPNHPQISETQDREGSKDEL